MEQTQSSPPVPDKILNANFIKIWFGQLFYMLNLSSFNLLPYFLELRGASPDLYGQVMGSMGISNLICLILLARRADVWSRKGTVLFWFGASLLGNLIAIWAMGRPELEWYYLPRLLQGVFMALGFPLVFTWALELCPPNKRQVALAWFGIGGLLANSLGPTLTEIVLSLAGDPNNPANYLYVFIMTTVFHLMALGVFLTVDNTRADNAGGTTLGMTPLLRRRETLYTIFIGMSFGGMFGSLMSFGKNFTVHIGLEYVSVLLWAYTIGAILSRIFIQQITRHINEVHLIPAGLLGLGLTFLLLGHSWDYWTIGAMGLFYGFSHGVLYPTLFVRFINYQQPNEMGRATSLFQGFFAVGWGFFPMAGGTVIRVAGFTTLFSLLTAFAGICIMLFLSSEKHHRNRTMK